MTLGTGNTPGATQNPSGQSPGQTEVYGSQSGGMATTSHGRSAGTRACPKCGSAVSAHASVCPVCGESLNGRSQQIRCRYCGGRSSSELTICPSCGRELTSAPPRWLTMGIPAILAVLFLVFVVSQVDRHNPLSWAQDRLTIEGFPLREPDRGLVVVMTPVAEDDSAVEAILDEATPVTSALAVDLEGDQLTAAQVDVERVVSEADTEDRSEVATEDSIENTAEVEDRSGAVDDITDAPVDAGSSELEQSLASDALSTDEAIDREEKASTDPTTDAREAQSDDNEDDTTVNESETSGSASDVPATEENDTEDSSSNESESSESLLAVVASSAGAASAAILPTASPTSAPTSTPDASPTPSVAPTETPIPSATFVPMPEYKIKRGDTLVVIAQRYDVSMDDLMRVNDITAIDAFALQPGDELTIPVEGSLGAAEPTATPTPTVTQTPVVPPTNTPLPTPTAPAYRVDAPILRSPEPGTPMSCSTADSLVWLPVPFMRDDDQFILHLGFVSGRMEDGREMVVWVLEQPRPASATSWDMDGTLCALAPQEYGRKWKWYVDVVENIDGGTRAVSPPSETWDFSWN